MKQYLLAAALLLVPGLAFAQVNPGPFGGLFGRAPSREGVDYRVFEIRASGGAQWNDFLTEQPPDQPEPPFAGGLGHATAAMAYFRGSDRLDLQAGSRAEYRDSFEEPTRGTTFDGGMMLTGRLTTRVTTDIAVNYRRSPFYQFYPTYTWIGDGVVIPGVPYDVKTIGYHSGDVRVGGSYQYSKGSTLTASASRGEMWFSSSPINDVTLSTYEGLWTRRLNRSFLLRLGYRHRDTRHHTAAIPNLVEEEIDVGVDFHRALTISPRTTVAFTTHTSIARRPNEDPLYRLNGDFRLTKQFQRTWKLELDARRATEVLAGFGEPLFSDSLAVSMSGLLSHRIEFMTMLSGKRGRFGYEGERGPFTMAGATTSLNIALARRLGVYAQYGFYHHSAPTDAFSITAIGELSRQTFTAGITTWIPVYTRERTPSDSR